MIHINLLTVQFMNRKSPVFNSEKPEDATYVVWFASFFLKINI